MKEICEFCEQLVDDYLLENHKKFFHADEFPEEKEEVICDICGERFESDSSLSRHRLSHFTPAPVTIRCNECGSTFDSQTKLMLHIKNYHAPQDFENDIYQCDICFEILYDENKYSNHMGDHFGPVNKPYDCPLCPGKCAREVHILRAHTDIYRKMRKYPCTLCDKRFFGEASALKHIEKHSRKGRYLCPECGCGYPTAQTLVDHRTFHLSYEIKPPPPSKYQGTPKYTSCPICGKEYAPTKKRHILIKKHMEVVHEGVFNYTCDICGAGFAIKNRLARHRGRHFKKEQCTMCRVRVDNLKEHYDQFHSNLKHECNLCGKRFNRMNDLRKHLRTHQERQFICDICDHRYLDINSMRRHVTIHFNGNMGGARKKLEKIDKSLAEGYYIESD